MEVETKKMTCVKCPATGEFDMIMNCISCGYSKNVIEKGEEFKCLYLEKRREDFIIDVHDYIMDEMEPWELDAYINEKSKLKYREIGNTLFIYNPNEIKIDDELEDYMYELAHCTSETEYRLEVANDDVMFKKRDNYSSY